MIKMLLIDNYDSFSFNVYQLISQVNQNLIVKRNDQVDSHWIKNNKITHIIISPGPGNPSQTGNCLGIIKNFYQKLPILGICLGHQTLAEFFGAKIIKDVSPTHGKISCISHNSEGLFKSILTPLQVARYHSLIVDKDNFPKCLKITAEIDNTIMAFQHRQYKNIQGIQFHPESFLSHSGIQIIKNFLKISDET